METAAVDNRYLRCLTGVGQLVLRATEGRRTIASDGGGILARVDDNFTAWGANEPGGPRPATPVTVYEMHQDDADLLSLFSSLTSDENLRNLDLTHDQILCFLESYRPYLRTGGQATFFLFGSGGRYFVAAIKEQTNGLLRGDVEQLMDPFKHYAGYKARVVVPTP